MLYGELSKWEDDKLFLESQGQVVPPLSLINSIELLCSANKDAMDI